MSWIGNLRIPVGHRVELDRYDPDSTPGSKGKDQALAALDRVRAQLPELQYKLYAENRRALLIVLQAMDAGGKDETIRHVISAFNPQGCTVTSFKTPTVEEMDHDFLWRIHRSVPRRGEIGVFNRSQYEDVLIVRVHDLVPRSVWKDRYDQINRFEDLLVRNDVVIVKFFLHISREEQRERLEARRNDPRRNWKFSESDLVERRYWDAYRRAYEDVLSRCNTESAPWFLIPANRKWYRNLAVASVLLETLTAMKMKFPRPAPSRG